MNHKLLKTYAGRIVPALAAVMLLAAPSFAKDVYLVAREFTQTINATPITMWGFAEADAGFANVGAASSPGPVVTVPVGDTVLNIYLRNDLPAASGESISIVIPGQAAVMNPEFNGGRVASFTHSTPPDGTTVKTYTWNNFKSGTYVYHSGSHPGLQVHMGLYGAVKKDIAEGRAYPAIYYDSEQIVFYSEIDAALHDPAPAVARPLTYKPAYFLVNGKPFDPGDPNWLAGAANQSILLRFINTGLKTHVPTIMNQYWKVVAEDGNPYAYQKEQYSVFLPAMKTMDVIWRPAAEGVYPVYDGRYFLTTNQVSGGGMLTYLEVEAADASLPMTAPDAYAVNEDTVLAVPAPGVLANDAAVPLTASLVSGALNGAVILNADGSFTYTPAPGYFGTDSFSYRVFNGVAYSANTIVSITIAPLTKNDFNNDGLSDILWWNGSLGQADVWYINSVNKTGEAALDNFPTTRKLEGAGDFNGDGDPDILWRDTVTGQLSIWLMAGVTATQKTVVSTPSLNWRIFGVGDFDGDGKSDILWRYMNFNDIQGGKTFISLMNGVSIKSSAYVAGKVPAAWEIMGAGDFDGDGMSDVLWRCTDAGDSNAGKSYVWLMNGLTIKSAAFPGGAVPLAWQVQGLADFDGDGKDDILWRHMDESVPADVGKAVMWFMNGLTIKKSDYFRNTRNGLLQTPLVWSMDAFGDYNNDGMADILFRRTDRGSVLNCLMNGNVLQTQGFLGTRTGAEWKIVK